MSTKGMTDCETSADLITNPSVESPSPITPSHTTPCNLILLQCTAVRSILLLRIHPTTNRPAARSSQQRAIRAEPTSTLSLSTPEARRHADRQRDDGVLLLHAETARSQMGACPSPHHHAHALLQPLATTRSRSPPIPIPLPPRTRKPAPPLPALTHTLPLKQIDWPAVASRHGISNGHAARMRYSRFKQQMEATAPLIRARRGRRPKAAAADADAAGKTARKRACVSDDEDDEADECKKRVKVESGERVKREEGGAEGEGEGEVKVEVGVKMEGEGEVEAEVKAEDDDGEEDEVVEIGEVVKCEPVEEGNAVAVKYERP